MLSPLQTGTELHFTPRVNPDQFATVLILTDKYHTRIRTKWNKVYSSNGHSTVTSTKSNQYAAFHY